MSRLECWIVGMGAAIAMKYFGLLHATTWYELLAGTYYSGFLLALHWFINLLERSK